MLASLSGLASSPALFIALLAVLSLALPCAYLYQALAERGVLRRWLGD
jgi:hypothetical protein